MIVPLNDLVIIYVNVATSLGLRILDRLCQDTTGNASTGRWLPSCIGLTSHGNTLSIIRAPGWDDAAAVSAGRMSPC